MPVVQMEEWLVLLALREGNCTRKTWSMLPSYSVVERIENCLENGTLNVTLDTHAYSSLVMVVGAFLILVMNEVRSTREFSDL